MSMISRVQNSHLLFLFLTIELLKIKIKMQKKEEEANIAKIGQLLQVQRIKILTTADSS